MKIRSILLVFIIVGVLSSCASADHGLHKGWQKQEGKNFEKSLNKAIKETGKAIKKAGKETEKAIKKTKVKIRNND